MPKLNPLSDSVKEPRLGENKPEPPLKQSGRNSFQTSRVSYILTKQSKLAIWNERSRRPRPWRKGHLNLSPIEKKHLPRCPRRGNFHLLLLKYGRWIRQLSMLLVEYAMWGLQIRSSAKSDGANVVEFQKHFGEEHCYDPQRKTGHRFNSKIHGIPFHLPGMGGLNILLIPFKCTLSIPECGDGKGVT